MKIFIILIILLLSSCSNRPQDVSPRKTALPKTTLPSKQEESVPQPPPTTVSVEETLSESFTVLYDKSSPRLNNIHLACGSINGTELFSGSEFSFNDICGARTTEKGYQNATVLNNKKLEKGIGGGVCQVSSTIHMAVINAGLKITERHAHSASVHYTSQGLDAAVSYGYLDFKFLNTSPDSIFIYTWCDNEKVFAKITHKVIVTV